MRAGDLYNLVLLRLKPFLRGSVKELIGHHRKTLQSKNQLSSTSLQSMSNTNLETLSNNNANITTSTTINEINPNDHKIRMGNTDDVIGGEVIPSKGFTLRLINGGSGSSGSSCSNCSWLSRCQGCIIPDSDYCSIDLRDGESIAIDWHFVVFEDLLDTIAATNITKHESIIRENNIHNDTRIPLSKCLDKFTEEEKLEGIVCPKCKSDDKLTRSFSIWRHPGILIIQIKRFQFDRTSRKKLTQRIDFPIDNFDILRYLVKYQNNCAVSNSNTDSDVKSLALDDINLNLTTAEHSAIDRECSEYDLYSVIHHVGALGGGHYVTTVRQPTSKSDRDKAPATTNNTSNAEKSGDDNENKDKWYCFNDNIMNEVKDITEITSPSAYVLFYVRKDMKQKSINEVLSHFYLEHLGKESVPTTASSTAPAPLAHDDMKNKKPRNGIMKTANNSNMSINVPAVNITMNDANTSNSGAITPTNSKRVTFDKSPEVSSHRKIPADRPNATVISGNIAEAEAMGIEEGDREASEGCNIQ